MWRFTCLPRTVYDFLYPFKPLFSLLASASLCYLLLALGRHHPRSGGGYPQRAVSIPAPASVVWGADPYVAFGQMGCPSRHERYGRQGVAVATATLRWQALPDW